MKVVSKAKSAGKLFTVDIEVGGNDGTHTYQIVTDSGRSIVSHNTVS